MGKRTADSNPSYAMSCPACSHGQAFTVDTRPSGVWVRRRRECANCRHRYTTYETLTDPRDQRPATPEEILGAALLAAIEHSAVVGALREHVAALTERLDRLEEERQPHYVDLVPVHAPSAVQRWP